MPKCIYVLAGTNGAGKSSLGGAMLRAVDVDYFNPDEAARSILAANPTATQAEANAAAWREGKRLLERAIAEDLDFAFESTLGGHTIPRLLGEALDRRMEVRIWYAGLASPELHIARVRARVKKGGHDIPDADIRRRFDASREHLIDLVPRLTELRVYDNSAEADPDLGTRPVPVLVLHLQRGQIVFPSNPSALSKTPEWAKPIVAVALRRVDGR